MSPLTSPRLYVQADLGADRMVTVSPEQAHYLLRVMRLKIGDEVRLFNGRDGEWRGLIGASSKSALNLTAQEQNRPQKMETDLWLCCAPIKKTHFDFMIEKATELGVAAIHPLLTARTQIREVNAKRCQAIAIEATEQSGRLTIPEIATPAALSALAAGWPKDRALIVCAEWGDAAPAAETLMQPHFKTAKKTAILTGPEGGFTAEELDALRRIPGAGFIRLGPRILRADTAAIAALSCWQALCGDWR